MFKNLFLNLFGSKHEKRLYQYKLRKASQKPVEYPEPTEEENTIYNGILEMFKQYPPNNWTESCGRLIHVNAGVRITINNGMIWLLEYDPHPKLAEDLYIYYKDYMRNYKKEEAQKKKENELKKLLKVSSKKALDNKV